MPGVIGAVTLFAKSSALAGFAVRIGTSLLLSAASRALMPKPSTGSLNQARTLTVREPVRPRDVVYGAVRKGGTIVFMEESGGSFLHLVIVLASHQVEEIGAIYFDGVKVMEADGSFVTDPIEGKSKTPAQLFGSNVTVEKRLGTADQTAFEGLQAALPELWTGDHRLRGCAAIYLRLQSSADAFPNGVPNVSVDLRGKNDVLDPRTGTRGYTNNAALCLADYMADENWGVGAPISDDDGVLADDLIAAANVCDEAVPRAGGGTEPRYPSDGVITLDQTPKTIIEAMLTAMAGEVAGQGGLYRILPGAWRPPVGSFAFNEDLAREGGVSVQTRTSASENFNGVRGQFISPENDWQPDDFPAYASDIYLAEDSGQRRWKDISLPFTTSAATAQRIAKIVLETERRQFRVQFSGKLRSWLAEIGDTAPFSYARWGFDAKPFKVSKVTLNLTNVDDVPALLPDFELRETSPLIWDWSASEEQVYAAAPRTNLPSAFDVVEPGVPNIAESLYVTRDGAGVKVQANLDWVAASGFIARYEVQGSMAGGDWIDLGQTSGTRLEARDISPGVWEFRIRAISSLGVASDWVSRKQEIFGLAAPPQPLTEVSLQTAGGLAVLKWTLHPDLDVRLGGEIVIRHTKSASPVWPTSALMDTVPGSTAIAVLPLKPGAYLLRARDSTGNFGPVAVVKTKGAQALPFSPVDLLQADPAFPGAKENVGVSEGALTLVGAALIDDWSFIDDVERWDFEGGPAAQGIYSFAAALDFGDESAVRLRSEIAFDVLNFTDRIDDRDQLIDLWLDFDGTDGAEVDVMLEVRHTDDDPAGVPSWTGWQRLDNAEIAARAVEARAILMTTDTGFLPLVTELRLHADEVIT